MTISSYADEVLQLTKDELLHLTAAEMGLKFNEEKEGSRLTVYLQAGFPVNSLHTHFLPMIKAKLQQIYPSLQIDTHLDFFVKAHRTQLAGKGLRGVKNTIAIASGKGGVGKSTVAVNLATALARCGARVGILDADIYGPSIPLMLGQHQPVEVSEEHYLPVKVHGIQAMSIGYLMPSDEQALIWRGPMLAKSLIQMLDLTLWDELDYLLIDLPPGTGDIQLSLVQKIPLTGAVIVTTPQAVATLDAQKAIQMFSKTNIDVLGLVENMSFHTCSHCGHQDNLFGEGGGKKLASTFNIPLLGQLPLDNRIRSHCDEGRPTAAHAKDELALAFTKTALNLAINLAKKPLNYADRFPPIVVE
ncbi:chromosome partitioning ATP-binding protein [Legionella beliardensis]|uniref:Iron-sulfur cluster carrier protein n=1 Tax=Legionella beliardensis TaxID=91822 RepID=A0A378I474_9GAMM|nr:iron-sulfur cluster carrier protein ApbC [Legionella beliardensis]STX29515.1 chromosome partitioning ATP-binding protein [Legionella beliardensis]